MQPHIILLMNKPIEIGKSKWATGSEKGIHYAELIHCDNEDDPMIFAGFDEAKRHQDSYAIDGRVVPLPIY
jgi:hypothetical protein